MKLVYLAVLLLVIANADAAFYCRTPRNASYTTDAQTYFSWSAEAANWKNYTLVISDSRTFTGNNTNITLLGSSANTSVNVSLDFNKQYYWYVVAGRTTNDELAASNCTFAIPSVYDTTSVCAMLHAGMNQCGYVDSASPKNVSQLMIELNATYISQYVNDNHSFISYTSNKSSWFNISDGGVYSIWLQRDTNWTNRSYGINKSLGKVNLSYRGNGWNAIAMLNRTPTNISTISTYMCNSSSYLKVGAVSNITYYSYYDNEEQKYYPFIWNWTHNNGTLVRTGEVIWMHFTNSTYPNSTNRTWYQYNRRW